MEPRQLERSDVIGSDNLLIIPCLVEGIPVEGSCVVFQSDGTPQIEITYAKGIPNGLFREYWFGRRLATEGQFHYGVQVGVWRYLITGDTFTEIRFINGRQTTRFDQYRGKSCE